MSAKKKTKKNVVEIYRTIRKGWNGVNPVERVDEDKRYKIKDKESRKEIDKYKRMED